MCCCFIFLAVLSALFIFLFIGLFLFLLVAALCLPSFSPRVRCPRLLFASFCGPSSLVLHTPGLLPLPLVGLFLLPLLTCLLLFTQYSWACCFWGLFLLTLRFLLSWLRPLGRFPGGFQSFYLRHVQFSSSRGFGWGPVVAAGAVRSLVVNIYMCISLCVRCCFFILPFLAKSDVPLGGGRCSSPLASLHVNVLRRRSPKSGC